jgi:ParB-like chromosome segregation protein Spo0J
MIVRDRIQGLRRVKAGELRPNPKNWRTHPQHQQDAVRGILAEIGYASALLARPLDDGTLELIDGHLRAETTPDMEVPVLVLDLTGEEADKLLALCDPLAAMAETNETALAGLLDQVRTDNEALQRTLEDLAAGLECPLAEDVDPHADAVAIPALYQVVVECRDEAGQRTLYERLKGEGYDCRLLNL